MSKLTGCTTGAQAVRIVWRRCYYGESQINVESGRSEPTRFGIRGIDPHIHVLYRGLVSGDTKLEEREELALKIERILNGEATYDGTFTRLSETRGSWQGIPFVATGPCVDVNPPWCHWEQDESVEACNARARLMDRVFGLRSRVEVQR